MKQNYPNYRQCRQGRGTFFLGPFALSLPIYKKFLSNGAKWSKMAKSETFIVIAKVLEIFLIGNCSKLAYEVPRTYEKMCPLFKF